LHEGFDKGSDPLPPLTGREKLVSSQTTNLSLELKIHMATFLKTILVTCFFAPYILSAQQADTSRSYTSGDGVKIYYEVKGKGNAVILLHGFTGIGESWKKAALYKDLLNAGFQVVTPDMRGNGRSDKPHTPEAYENDIEAKDIMGIATQLKLKKYAVVGYSRGAIIASRVLVLDKRVSKAVLGGMGSDFMNPEWPRRIMFYKALMGESVPELEGMVKSVKDRGLDQTAQAYLQKAQPSTSKEEFSKVKKPVLVICGDKDEDNGSSKALAEVIPNSEYKRVPGDHGGTSRTKEFATEVLAFLKAK
jgi:pimeloyl-ACP methyl ester carboxylesterase